MKNILLVEDNQEVQLLVSATLDGYKVTTVGTLEEALKKLTAEVFDLVLLDVQLPDGDGFHFVLQAQGLGCLKDIPVIFLTARKETVDKVMGFRLGADDYITKPFDCLELKARVEARLKSRSDSEDRMQNIVRGNLRLDLLRGRAALSKPGLGEERIDTTPFEFKLLVFLVRHEDHVLSREKLVESVWQDGLNVSDRTVDTHMSHIRQKLRGSGYSIQSVYGEGYRFSKVRNSFTDASTQIRREA